MPDQRSPAAVPGEPTRDFPTELQRTLPGPAYLGQEGWRAEVEEIFTSCSCEPGAARCAGSTTSAATGGAAS